MSTDAEPATKQEMRTDVMCFMWGKEVFISRVSPEEMEINYRVRRELFDQYGDDLESKADELGLLLRYETGKISFWRTNGSITENEKRTAQTWCRNGEEWLFSIEEREGGYESLEARKI